MRTEINGRYLIQPRTLNNMMQSSSYYPILPTIVENPRNGMSSYPFTENVLFDSGASLSILHQRRSGLFANTTPIDNTTIVFGTTETKLNVYEVVLRIQGIEFRIFAALAKDMKINYTLLGYFKGIEVFDYIIMNNKRREYKFVSQYGL